MDAGLGVLGVMIWGVVAALAVGVTLMIRRSQPPRFP